MSNTSNEIIRMIENAESNHQCIRPITSAQKQYAYRCVKKGTFVRTFRNLCARTEYWQKLYPSEKMRHIAISLMEIYPEWKFTGLTAAALLGYDIVENYDDVEDGSDNIQCNFSPSVSSTKIYIRSSVHKSANDNPYLHRIMRTCKELDGTSDDVRIVQPSRKYDGQLITLPHSSDRVSYEIRSHIVDKSTMLFDVANTVNFRTALPIFDSAARDNVNFNKVLEICGRRYGASAGGRRNGCANEFKYVNDVYDEYGSFNEEYEDLRTREKSVISANSAESFANAFAGGGFGKSCSKEYSLLRLRRLCFFKNGLSENGGESFARGTMIDLGFMVPELQHEFVAPNSRVKYRCDFLWRVSGGGLIVGELDGYDKYFVDSTNSTHANINFNSSSDTQMLRNSYNQTAINRNIDRQAERESVLFRECGVSKIVRFNFADVVGVKNLERKLVEAGVPRIMRVG